MKYAVGLPRLWWIEADEVVRCSGRPDGKIQGAAGEGSVYTVTSSGWTMPTFKAGLDPGPQELVWELQVRVYSGPTSDKKNSTLQHERVLRATRPFEVGANADDDHIVLVKDPALHQKIKSGVRPQLKPLADGSGYWIQFAIAPLPVALGFEVLARLDSEELLIGTFYLDAGRRDTTRAFVYRIDQRRIESVEWILRSSKDPLRDSLDLFEAWDGEIIYKNVAVDP